MSSIRDSTSFDHYHDYMNGFNARMNDLKTCKALARRKGNVTAVERVSFFTFIHNFYQSL